MLKKVNIVFKILEVIIILFLLITTLYQPKPHEIMYCLEDNRDRVNPQLYCEWKQMFDDVLGKGE